MKIKILLTVSFVFIITFKLLSQDQPRAFILNGNVSNTIPTFDNYKELVNQKFLSKLILLKKFNFLNRPDELIQIIENELKLQDFISNESALKIGNLQGATHYISITVSNFLCERIIRPDQNQAVDFIFKTDLSLAVKILNLETGKIEQVFDDGASINASDREKSILQSINLVTSNLVRKIDETYPIKTSVNINESKNEIVLAKGSEDGVKRFMYFVSTTPSGQVLAKVIKVEANQATAKIILGNNKWLSKQSNFIQSFQNFATKVEVTEVLKDKIQLNGGEDLGIKKGDLFYVGYLEAENKFNENPFLQISEVKEKTSVGKVIRGEKEFRTNIITTQASKQYKYKTSFFKVGYKLLPGISIKPTLSSGEIILSNQNTSFSVDTEYLNDYPELTNLAVYSIGFGLHNPVKKRATFLSADIYQTSKVSNWIVRFETGYVHPLLADKIHANIMPSVGYGRMKQHMPNAIVERLSNGESSYLTSNSFSFGIKTELWFTLKRFTIFVGAFYENLSYKNWKYEVEIENNKEDLKMNKSAIPYSEVDFSGLSLQMGLAYRY